MPGTDPFDADRVLAQLRSHRTIRAFAPVAVREADVQEAVRAGQAASTSSAVQAYSLLRVRDAAQRAALVPLCGGQEKVALAGAFFVVAGDARRYRLLARREGHAPAAKLESFLVPLIDATLFAQNLAVAFEALGYGVCFVGALRNRLLEVDRLLDVPEGLYPLYGLCVGVPAEDPLPRPRLPLAAVLHDGRWQTDAELLDVVDRYDDSYADYLRERDGTPGSWSRTLVNRFETPERSGLADYYRAKGAELT